MRKRNNLPTLLRGYLSETYTYICIISLILLLLLLLLFEIGDNHLD